MNALPNQLGKLKCPTCGAYRSFLVSTEPGGICYHCFLPTARDRLTAIHEASHLICLRELFPHREDFALSLNGNDGLCDYGDGFDILASNALAVHLAGYYGEEEAWRRALGRKPTYDEMQAGFDGSKHDFEIAEEILAADPKNRPQRSRRCKERLDDIFRRRWDDIVRLAGTLLEHRTLNSRQILEVLAAPKTLPRPRL